MKVRNGVTGDEGPTIGGRKMCKMGQKSKKLKDRQKSSKDNKKNEIVTDLLLEIAATTFHPTHHGQKKNEKFFKGGPWQCANVENTI